MRWESDRGGAAPPKYRGQDSLDREARVLAMWAEGFAASDIGAELRITRNTAIGIVNRSRGPFAERAKREHAAASRLRSPKGVPRVKRALQEPAQRDRVISIERNDPVPLDTLAGKAEPGRFPYHRQMTADFKRQRIAERAAKRSYLLKPPLPERELAERREQHAAAGRAAIARVELTLIENPAFVAKVEPPWDPYAHLRSDKGYRDAVAALSR